MTSLNYLEPCWCKMLNPLRGVKVNTDNPHINIEDGMPFCSDTCLLAYKRKKNPNVTEDRLVRTNGREKFRQKANVGGNNVGTPQSEIDDAFFEGMRLHRSEGRK